MATCGTCGNVTDEARCPVDGTSLRDIREIYAELTKAPITPEQIAAVEAPPPVVDEPELPPPGAKKSRRKS